MTPDANDKPGATMNKKDYAKLVSEFGESFAERAVNWFTAEFTAEFRAGVKDVVTFVRNNEYLIYRHRGAVR